MNWEPISETDLLNKVNQAWGRMTPPERHFWETIRIEQEKWQCSPWGDRGQGFWAVAVMGKMVVWYNDIEDGFNCSAYQLFGEFKDYWCNQDGLDDVVKVLKGNLDHCRSGLWQAGPPKPL
ncbi:hypothetical protein [Salipiger abyssi]|uniref:hypothetical protein n=1 Tax=Salipiger abyssi TaxID=1250539 RepID=UPI0040594CA2